MSRHSYSDLSEEQQLLQTSVRRFVAAQITPFAQQWDRAAALPPTLMAQLAELGILGTTVPQNYGGSGLGTAEMAIVMEELAQGSGAVALTVAAHSGLCCAHLLQAGNHAQKQHYLPDLVHGKQQGAWALTEPDSGSDAANMQTQAVLHRDCYILDGSKVFITQGTVADFIIVLASTDKSQGSHGISAFLVAGQSPGLLRQSLGHKLGMRASDTALLTLNQVKVPSNCLLGELNHGFIDTLRILDSGRIGIAATAVGLAEAAYGAAKRYVSQRSQFKQRLNTFQTIQFKLADMLTQIQAARQLTRRAAWMVDNHQSCRQEAASAKLFASEMAMRVTEEAVQMHGGYGYLDEFPVERFFRDAKLCTIGEGTSEIQRLVIARTLLKDT